MDTPQGPEPTSTFFNQTVWVFGSVAVISLAGAALTFWLAAFAGREALGVFNQLYALYVILAQLFVFGVNDSVLKHSAQHRNDPQARQAALKSALACAFCTGLAGSVITFALAGPIAFMTDSAAVGDGVVYIAPAVFLFALNKVLSSYVNGVQRMRYYAATQSLRGVLLVTFIAIIASNGSPMSHFGLGFVGAELGVLLTFSPILLGAVRAKTNPGELWSWCKRHIQFGLRVLPHGLLTESFFRIDILVLAIFLSDADVGLYSFIAFFIEGILQIPYIVKIVTTPRLVAIMQSKNPGAFRRQAIRSLPASAAMTVIASIVVVLAFPLVQEWFPLVADPRGTTILHILLVGVCIYALFAPFESIFIAAGRPDIQSLFMMIVTVTNIVLNIALIPLYDLTGAAAATSVTFLFSSVLLNLLAIKTFRIHTWNGNN